MNKQLLLDNLRNIPDFPIVGVQFKDVSTLFKNAECVQEMLNEMERLYKDKGITKIVGVESRGFVLGAALADRLRCGFVMCRKPGKLPGDVVIEQYHKEYGKDQIEIHIGSIEPDDVVLIHDDIMATGGSLMATYRLVKKFNPKEVHVNFIMELRCEGLQGYKHLQENNVDYTALLTIEE